MKVRFAVRYEAAGVVEVDVADAELEAVQHGGELPDRVSDAVDAAIGQRVDEVALLWLHHVEPVA